MISFYRFFKNPPCPPFAKAAASPVAKGGGRGILYLSLWLSACTVSPDYHRPAIAIPNQWHAAKALPSLPASDKWWRNFNDPILNQLVNEAIAANLDLKQAMTRIKDSRAQRVAIFAAALPVVSANSNASRRLNSLSGGQAGAAGGGFGIGNQLITIFQSGFDAAWELDFFGGVKRAAEAADATVESEVENSRAVLVTLLAEVAVNYAELRASQALLAISQEQVRTALASRDLLMVRAQAGLTDSLAVTATEAQIADLQANLPGYVQDIQLRSHALSVLLGREPGALTARLAAKAPLPSMAQEVIPDLPSELLKRRPDIRRAERQMAAASATTGAAITELYPKLNLSAFLGLQNTRISDALPLGKSWSTAASISMPIFNWGRIKADIKSKQAQSELAFFSYQATVLSAFKEVEDALIAHRQEQARQKALTQAMTAKELSVNLAEQRYRSGITGFLEVLEAEQNRYQTENDLTASKTAQTKQLIALYKAMGGGWQSEASVSGDCGKCEKALAEQVYDLSKSINKSFKP